MCGIVAQVGVKERKVPELVSMLEPLESRGYDSAGITWIDPEGILVAVKSVGKVMVLREAVAVCNYPARVSIAHTRWAVHGEPSERNAHPHFDCLREIAVVHNGTIENHAELKQELGQGHKWRSDTDTEVVAHLIEENLKTVDSLEDAISKALRRLRGSFALAILSSHAPDQIFLARQGTTPICIGYGKDEMIAASDPLVFASVADRAIYLESGELAVMSSASVRVMSFSKNTIVEKVPQTVKVMERVLDRGGFAHFMLQEIHAQPQAIADCIKGRIGRGEVILPELDALAGFVPEEASRMILTGCGTSMNAAFVGRRMIEGNARLPVIADYASELAYSDPVLFSDDVMIALSQSGETADTLIALKLAKRNKLTTIGIVNEEKSSIARESDACLLLNAGPEIGVASTKAFTSQLSMLALLTVYASQRSGVMGETKAAKILEELALIPEKISSILRMNSLLHSIASDIKHHPNALFLGRGYQYPVAREGALKMTEVSYMHAEGHTAAEMKHGPIALIDKDMPVVVIIPTDAMFEKVMGNIAEIKARKGRVVAIATRESRELSRLADHVIVVPETIDMLQSILTVIPLQLLAYHVAVLRGCDVDKPRNLAKSVTVE